MQKKIGMKATVTVLNGPDKGTSYEIKDHLKIGRDKTIDLWIDDNQASRAHAEICRDNGFYYIRDLDSLNGTFLNDKRISTANLSSNDEIRIGNVCLVFTHSLPIGKEDLPSRAVVLSDTEKIPAVCFGLPATETSIRPKHIGEVDYRKARAIYNQYDALIETIEVITGSLDLENHLDQVAEKVFNIFNANRMAILLRDENRELKPVAYLTQNNPASAGEEIRISRSIAKKVLEDKSSVILNNIMADDRFKQEASIKKIGIQSAMCAPLIYKGEVLGLIYLDSTKSRAAFSEEGLRMLSVVARSLAVALSNSHFYQKVQDTKIEIKKAYIDTISVLVNTIEARDHYTAGHTWRVTQFSIAIAKELDWPEEEIEELKMAAALHDIGKISYSDTILRKPSVLSESEYEKIKCHPRKGVEILKNINFLEPVQQFILHHHERWDGQGYSAGLKETEISEGGRIIAVADTFDALTSDRPYRSGITPEKAIKTLKKVSGSQLDPKIVDAFMRVWKKGKVKNIIQKYNKKTNHSVICPFCSTWITIPPELNTSESFECLICKKKLEVIEKEQNLKVQLI